MKVTLAELRALGLAWPVGPEPPPADENEAVDLGGFATGLESLYHDFKGDRRSSEQKEGVDRTSISTSTSRTCSPRSSVGSDRRFGSSPSRLRAVHFIGGVPTRPQSVEQVRSSGFADVVGRPGLFAVSPKSRDN